VRGLSLLAAQKVMVPSGPNITLILGLTIAAALGVGIWLAWRLGPRRPVRSQRLAVLGELFFRARPRIIDLAFGFLHATERLRCFLQRATHLARQSQYIQFGALSTEKTKPAGSNTILDSSPTTFDGRHQHSATHRREP
jgi:hypothetical protein